MHRARPSGHAVDSRANLCYKPARMKWTRVRKLTWKLLFVYALVLVLLAFADPDPRKPYFWIGLVLLTLGQLVRFWAAGHLVKNQRLTTTGPYAHVKNPLYIGTLLVMAGFGTIAQSGGYDHWALNNMNWILLGFAVLMFVFAYVPYKKKREGDRLRRNFGEEWDVYDRNVPDYFPRLSTYHHQDAEPVRWSARVVVDNSEHWTPIAIAAGIVAIIFSHEIIDFAQRHVG